MADQLSQIVTFVAVGPGATVVLPHNINVNGYPQVPDLVFPSAGSFTVTADAANVTLTNNGSVPATFSVYLWLQHSILRAYDGVQVTGLVPRPFYVAGGGDGVSGGVTYDFVFQPGGVTIDNVHADYTSLILAVMAVIGRKRIFYDNSFAPCIVPAGVWDVTDVVHCTTLDQVTVEVQEGASFIGFREADQGIRFNFSGGTPPVSDLGAATFVKASGGAGFAATGTGPFFDVTTAGALIWFIFDDGSTLVGLESIALGREVVRLTGVGSTGMFVTGESSTVQADTVEGIGGTTMVAAVASSSGFINETQVNFLGTLSVQNGTAARLNPTAIKTGAYVAVINDEVRGDPTGGAFPVTLPAAFNNRGKCVVVKNVSASPNAITVTAGGGDNIDGAATDVLAAAHGSRTYQSDGDHTWDLVAAYPSGSASTAQVFTYVATGAEVAAGFIVTLPAARASALYTVNASLTDVAVHFVPAFPVAGKTTTQFNCVPDFNLTAGDTIIFTVEDLT